MTAGGPERHPRLFRLVRDGRQTVAEGVVWSTGRITVNWPGRASSLSSRAELDELVAADDGLVEIEWDEASDDHGECVEYYDGAIWVH